MLPHVPTDWSRGAAAIVLAVTLVGVAVGRYPRLRMNRATIALVGAVLLVALGAVPLERARAAVDLDTLGLLLGMMVLNANLRLAGFFRLVAAKLASRAHSQRQLLAALTLGAGVLSALFLNDTVVLALTPLVLEVTAAARLRPIPYLVALATAANVGSVATLVGNPQNMLIGVASGIPFLRFASVLAPVALGGLAVVYLVILVVYRRDLARRPDPPDPAETIPTERVATFRPLLRKSVAATCLLVAALAVGVPPALAALGAASVLLVTRRVKPERVFRELDWSLLVFFSGLFVVTAAVEETGVAAALYRLLEGAAATDLPAFVGIVAALSNLVSNVPAVMLLRPVMEQLPQAETAWLALAMGTTLAGNLTLLGSVANLIVAETAQRRRVRLGFLEYLRAGLPITLLSLAWGTVWLGLVR